VGFTTAENSKATGEILFSLRQNFNTTLFDAFKLVFKTNQRLILMVELISLVFNQLMIYQMSLSCFLSQVRQYNSIGLGKMPLQLFLDLTHKRALIRNLYDKHQINCW